MLTHIIPSAARPKAEPVEGEPKAERSSGIGLTDKKIGGNEQKKRGHYFFRRVIKQIDFTKKSKRKMTIMSQIKILIKNFRKIP